MNVCVAMLATEITEVQESMLQKLSKTTFFTDSKAVLGYVHNKP